MKLKLATVASAMLVLSIVGAGVASAKGPNGHPSGATGSAASAAQHTPSFSARCSASAQGGSIKVLAQVKHGVRGKSFSATASGAFTSTTVQVNLKRSGKSFSATGKILVPAGQVVGPVVVTVTITYDGVQHVLTCTSNVHAAAADTDNDND
jgi:hypothetical protein